MWFFDARLRDNEKFCENIDRIIRSRSPGVTARDLATLMGKLPPFISQVLRKKSPPPALTLWDLELIAHVLKIDRKKLIEIYLRETRKLYVDVRLDIELDFALEVAEQWREKILKQKEEENPGT